MPRSRFRGEGSSLVGSSAHRRYRVLAVRPRARRRRTPAPAAARSPASAARAPTPRSRSARRPVSRRNRLAGERAARRGAALRRQRPSDAASASAERRQRRRSATDMCPGGRPPRATAPPRTAPAPTLSRPACTAAWQPSPAAPLSSRRRSPGSGTGGRGRPRWRAARRGCRARETAAHAARVRAARAVLPAGYPRRHTPGTAPVEPRPPTAAPPATS